MARLGEIGLESAVLVPCTDPWCEVVAGLPSSAQNRCLASQPDRDVVELLLDKALLAQALDRLDVPHPTTFELTAESQLEDMTTPIFLKPRSSARFFDTFGRKAMAFDNRRQAIAAFRAMTERGFSPILQEYVPGPPTAHLFIDGFVDREGVCRARFVRTRVRMYPLDFGNSTMTASAPIETARDAVADLDRLLAGLHYRGPFNAEFKRDARDGVAKLVEVNCRPWWYIDFAADCGVDISMMIYRDALGLPVSTVDDYAVGKRCGVLVDDIKAFRELRRSDELSVDRWLGSWIGASSPTFELDDPVPALAALMVVARRNFAKLGSRRNG